MQNFLHYLSFQSILMTVKKYKISIPLYTASLLNWTIMGRTSTHPMGYGFDSICQENRVTEYCLAQIVVHAFSATAFACWLRAWFIMITLRSPKDDCMTSHASNGWYALISFSRLYDTCFIRRNIGNIMYIYIYTLFLLSRAYKYYSVSDVSLFVLFG